MNRLASILISLLATLAIVPARAGTKLFIFAGQSNSQGYGNRTQLPPVPTWAQTTANGWEGHPTQSSDTGIQYAHPTLANSPSLYVESNSGSMSSLPGDAWGSYDGCNPATGFHPGEQGSYGPELTTLAKYRADHPGDEIVVIKVVLGGSSLADWSPTTPGNMWNVFTTILNESTNRLNAANKTYDFAGMFWIQGESGCSTVWPYLNDPDAYSRDLRTFIAAVRARTSPTMPFIIGRLGSQMYADAVIGTTNNGIDTPANRLAATQHREDQQQLVGTDPGNVSYDRHNLPTLQAGTDPANWYHLTGAGCLADGERAYVAWQQCVGEVPPPPPPPLIVKFNGNAVTDWTVKLNGADVGKSGDTIEITGQVP